MVRWPDDQMAGWPDDQKTGWPKTIWPEVYTGYTPNVLPVSSPMHTGANSLRPSNTDITLVAATQY